MNILSNVEFEKLVVDQSPRLRMLAKTKCDEAPSGYLTMDDVTGYIRACTYSGDPGAVSWLKSLVVLVKNGKIQRLRTNATTWDDHREEVTTLVRSGAVAFDISDHVLCKDCGRYGSIVDYLPDTKEYIVALDPFQIQTYKKKDLEKVAVKVAQIPGDEDEHPQGENISKWEITYDHLDEKPVSVQSPGFSDDGTDDWIKFKMYDDDGELYYSGRMNRYDFDPLDDYGMPNAGATALHYFQDGKWHVM